MENKKFFIINRFIHVDLLRKRLEKIFFFFAEMNCTETIEEYYPLWQELIELASTHSNEKIRLIATCCVVEICKHFIQVFPKNPLQNCSIAILSNLYDIIILQIKDTIYEKSDNYIWKYHLIRTLIESQFFKLSIWVAMCNDNDNIISNIWLKMCRTLHTIGCRLENAENLSFWIIEAIKQLIECSPELIPDHIVLTEICAPFIKNGKSMSTFIARKASTKLLLRHCYSLSTIVNQKILLQENIESFKGREIFVAECVVLASGNLYPFESLIIVVTKFVQNHCHIYHENITQLLAAFICRFGQLYGADIDKDLKKRTTLNHMILRFLGAMQHEHVRIYPNILIKYGSQLIDSSPNDTVKYRYLCLFKNYISRVPNVYRWPLIKIVGNFVNISNLPN